MGYWPLLRRGDKGGVGALEDCVWVGKMGWGRLRQHGTVVDFGVVVYQPSTKAQLRNYA